MTICEMLAATKQTNRPMAEVEHQLFCFAKIVGWKWSRMSAPTFFPEASIATFVNDYKHGINSYYIYYYFQYHYY